ncbi:MAG: Zn-dependent hydrolase [Ectothiorhodospiraceae bacterium]|nr:Zn-dependent hydrolase [Chromatiales bacterium]MCP5155669.1 Zn-dependent hydrolase [Ectothiorhodospiraceae bacterium]
MAESEVQRAVLARAALARELFAGLERETHDGVGITRASYGEGEARAHALMARGARELGLEVAHDAAGNTYMTLPGRDRSAPPIVVGSHLDSVAQGGNYDGAAGVVSGLVALAGLADAGVRPARDVRVMGIRAEESAWFGVSYIGSRCALGVLPEGALDGARRADTGRTLADHMADAGCAPERLRAGEIYLPPADVHAYLEVHIEQGPVLEAEGLPVGVVTGIRGNRRLPSARCTGEYSHCGGVPRSHRRDAVIATAELVGELDRIWTECDGAGRDFAFTVGKFFTDAEWHAMTKIAGEVRFSLDMRSLDAAFLDAMEARVASLAADIERRRGVSFDLGDYTRAAPGVLDQRIRGDLLEGVERLGIPYMEIASGASHDAAAFAAAGVPTAMVFIRNANGSHNPDEAMDVADFMEATRLLAWWIAERG